MIFRATRMACKEFDAIIIIVWDSHDSKARYIIFVQRNIWNNRGDYYGLPDVLDLILRAIRIEDGVPSPATASTLTAPLMRA